MLFHSQYCSSTFSTMECWITLELFSILCFLGNHQASSTTTITSISTVILVKTPCGWTLFTTPSVKQIEFTMKLFLVVVVLPQSKLLFQGVFQLIIVIVEEIINNEK